MELNWSAKIQLCFLHAWARVLTANGRADIRHPTQQHHIAPHRITPASPHHTQAMAEAKLTNLMERITADSALKAAFDADQTSWLIVVNNGLGSTKSKIQFLEKLIKENEKPADLTEAQESKWNDDIQQHSYDWNVGNL